MCSILQRLPKFIWGFKSNLPDSAWHKIQCLLQASRDTDISTQSDKEMLSLNWPQRNALAMESYQSLEWLPNTQLYITWHIHVHLQRAVCKDVLEVIITEP